MGHPLFQRHEQLCISTSECMRVHAFARSKIIKNALKLIFLCEPYMSLLYAWWKKYVLNNFIVFDHANACIRWSKYTTNNVNYKWVFSFRGIIDMSACTQCGEAKNSCFCWVTQKIHFKYQHCHNELNRKIHQFHFKSQQFNSKIILML